MIPHSRSGGYSEGPGDMVRRYPWVRAHTPPNPSPTQPSYYDHLGRRPRDEYIRTILSPNSWGGAIELTILAAHYRTEIASIDVETGRIDRFGNDAQGGRALLIYSGIHYDAAVLAPEPNAPQDFCVSVVPSIGAEGEQVLDALRALATKLRAKRAYTNTATFDLKCEVNRYYFSSPRSRGPYGCRSRRSAGRGSKARRRHVHMRQRRDTSSLANSRIMYSIFQTEMRGASHLYDVVSKFATDAESPSSLNCDDDVWNYLSAEPLPHPVNFIIIFSLRSASYPLPRINPNELVKRPQCLIQVTVVLAPHVGLSRDCLHHLAGSRERREISRDQAILYCPSDSVHGNWREGPQRVHIHLQADVFLIIISIYRHNSIQIRTSPSNTSRRVTSSDVRPDTSVPRTLFCSDVSSRPRSALPRSEGRIAG